MSTDNSPRPTVAVRGMACAADQLAASAGVITLARGGSAADAAVATGAAMAVVGPHLCGLGGDVLAMVQAPGTAPIALLGVGRAGSGADPERLRSDGHLDMPLRGDVRSVTVPGAVDGWSALHERFGRLPWRAVLEPAISLAEDGFAASTMLALASTLVAGLPGTLGLCPQGPLSMGERVRLSEVAGTLRDLATEGRAGFYEGRFGRALVELGAGEYADTDLRRPLAQWADPLCLRVLGHDVWTVPPPSQGYLTLAGAWIAERAGIPADPADAAWPDLLMRACRLAGVERPAVLYDGAPGAALVSEERLGPLAASLARRGIGAAAEIGGEEGTSVPPAAPGAAGSLSADGDTTHLCVVDGDGLGVSLTQSNALDFGSHLVAADTGVFLHNRGVGFSLERGHPGEYGPGRRPSHTLSPALVTTPDGSLSRLLGAMGGDAQPQVLVQLLVRMLAHGEDPASAVAAPRVVLEAVGAPPFRLWSGRPLSLLIEADAPAAWAPGLRARGEHVRVVGARNPVDVGCAQIIAVDRRVSGPVFAGGSDPRSPEGAALGW